MSEKSIVYDRFSCAKCSDDTRLDFDFTMAFQPIVNCQNNQIFGYEALVRGVGKMRRCCCLLSRINMSALN